MELPWRRLSNRDERHGRMVTHGELQLIVLHLLAQRPLTGLEVEWAIDRQLALAGLESASVEAAVGMLDQLDHIQMQTHGLTYAITSDGTALLEGNARLVEIVLTRIGFVGRPALHPDRSVPPSLDALRGAIGRRLARGGATGGQIQAATRATTLQRN